ncbi:hypothetical protein E2562_027937 [Oryza meyeriana var. granulata]|uniref:Cathepsin propeptide inhibitor domain-containing protein n=1 Tax=Oryza meyeriana var. granulata TaxID=110450 RepID=A0A6G1CTU1_9ORYZ|nr:hypothetical protein E2562_027937 [Oryza meyeriana var. granulata]
MKTSDDDERMMGSKRLTNEEEEALKVIFQEWMNKCNRNYKDEAEKAYRFEVFKSTVQRIGKHKYGDCECLPNNFADLTFEEVIQKYCSGKRKRR